MGVTGGAWRGDRLGDKPGDEATMMPYLYSLGGT